MDEQNKEKMAEALKKMVEKNKNAFLCANCGFGRNSPEESMVCPKCDTPMIILFSVELTIVRDEKNELDKKEKAL